MSKQCLTTQAFSRVVFLIVLLAYSTFIVAQDLNDVIVRVRSPDTETGTGIVIGSQGKRLYILTAKHVVKNFIDDEVHIYARQRSDLSFVAKVIDFDNDREDGDLAILEIDLDAAENIENGLFFSPNIFLPTMVGRSRILDCDINEVVQAIGHASGTFNQHWIPSVIQSRRYDNEDAYYTIGSSSIEGGISGSPLFNSNNELIGIVVSVNPDGKTAKVVAPSTVLNFLARHSIERNLLVQAPIVGNWVLSSVKLPEQNVIKMPPKWTLTISGNGKAYGLVNGHYCFKDKEQIQFRVLGIPTSIAIPQGNGIETSRAIRDKDYCKLRTSHGFNFASSLNTPSNGTRIAATLSTKEIVRTNQGMILSFLCQSTFGPVHYSFVKGE